MSCKYELIFSSSGLETKSCVHTVNLKNKEARWVVKCTPIIMSEFCLWFPFRTNILKGLVCLCFYVRFTKKARRLLIPLKSEAPSPRHHGRPSLGKPLQLIPGIPFYIKPSATQPETDTLGRTQQCPVLYLWKRVLLRREFKGIKDHCCYQRTVSIILWMNCAPHLEEWGWHIF